MTMLLCFHLLVAATTDAADGPRASCHPASILVPLPKKITLEEGVAPLSGPVAEVVDESRSDLGEEGYELYCHQEGYRLTARAKPGLFYGRQTLDQLKALGLVPCCTITDKPAMKLRGVMLDLARLKEKHEYYYHVIDQLAKWKINTVFLHLTDHIGCAVEFKRYPKLVTRYAFSQAEMKKLIKYASDRHIELIPEIESWGHARWITNVPEFADLAESPQKTGSLCTSNPKTWEVLGEIYRETAALFPGRYIHAGCDESSFGICDKCRAKVKAEGEDALVGEHLRRACELVKATGKTPMIWGDVLLHRRGSVEQVPRDAIVCHWDYKAALSAEPVQFLKGKGFEVVGCPAIVWGSREILPMADTWDNVANFAKIVLDHECLGMETTVWIPQRYISDTLGPALAHASEMSWSGNVRPRSQFMGSFAKLFFGLDPHPGLIEALIDVHGLSIKAYSKIVDVADYARRTLDTGTPDPPPLPDVAKTALSIAERLRQSRPSVTSHAEQYDSLILSAEIRAYVEDRAGAVDNLAQSLKSAKSLTDHGKASEAAAELRQSVPSLERLILVDKDLSARVSAAWDRWRYPDDPKKIDGGDNLTAGFARSKMFLSETVARLRAAADRADKGESIDPAAILK